MYQDFSYETVLAASYRAAWRIEDGIGLLVRSLEAFARGTLPPGSPSAPTT